MQPLGDLSGIWCTCFLSAQLHAFFFTNKTIQNTKYAGFSPPAQRFCSYEFPRQGAQPGVSTGSGAQGAAPVWAANQSEGRTKVLEILDQGSLTRRILFEGTRSLSPSLRQGPEHEKSCWSRVGAHACRVPPKFPGCKTTSPGVLISLSSC